MSFLTVQLYQKCHQYLFQLSSAGKKLVKPPAGNHCVDKLFEIIHRPTVLQNIDNFKTAVDLTAQIPVIPDLILAGTPAVFEKNLPAPVISVSHLTGSIMK
jgi:hypothetical protein